ncbi:GSCOCG00004608001-RA-CDS [Cotesia congregata]|nr:GSCOCG00004608001-RA-CDS [Cotesia congregata]
MIVGVIELSGHLPGSIKFAGEGEVTETADPSGASTETCAVPESVGVAVTAP